MIPGAAVIEVRDAGKRYVKFEDRPLVANTSLNVWTKTRRQDLWALRHVDFKADPGECLGIIGRNGAGKSTLLRLLAGVTAPTEGSVSVRGRLAPLVAVGVGFHPELTGRENVFANGTIMGLSRDQVEERFDAIVDFAEIGAFLDTPVKFYSSGMFVRLGFAVAVEAQPDILLVDEVLSVGDIAFQAKCFNRMMEIRASGTTLLVVSHSLEALRMMCDRAIVLDGGQVRFDGDVPRAISTYHGLLAKYHLPSEEEFHSTLVHQPGVVEARPLQVRTGAGESANAFAAGEEMVFAVRTSMLVGIGGLAFELSISDASGDLVYKEAARAEVAGRPGLRVDCEMRTHANLPSGSYKAQCLVLDSSLSRWFDVCGPAMFYVSGRETVRGVTDLRAHFDLTPPETTLPAARTGALTSLP